MLALAPPPPAHAYRFVAPPIVPIVVSSDGSPTFDVYVKLNRSVPRAEQLRGDVALHVQDAGGDTLVATLGRRGRHCFTAGIDSSLSKSRVLARPKAGAVVLVRLLIHGKVVASATTRLSRPLRARGEDVDGPYAEALSCV